MSGPERPDALTLLDVFVGEWSRRPASRASRKELARRPAPRSSGSSTAGSWCSARTCRYPKRQTALSIVYADPEAGGSTQHYCDARGVARRYAMSLDAGVWRLPREAPDFSPLDFCQRFTGTFSDDWATIDGSREKSFDGTVWEHDFALTYRRSG
jgi:hypothetical protein